jgi:hypothetical protein
MSEVEKARHLFDDAMRLMRGTPKARALCFDLFERAIAAVRAEIVGHVANCRCMKEHHRLEAKGGTVYKVHVDSWTDPRCLPGLKRAAIIRAEARVEALEAVGRRYDDAGGFDEAFLTEPIADARAELERLREK